MYGSGCENERTVLRLVSGFFFYLNTLKPTAMDETLNEVGMVAKMRKHFMGAMGFCTSLLKGLIRIAVPVIIFVIHHGINHKQLKH